MGFSIIIYNINNIIFFSLFLWFSVRICVYLCMWSSTVQSGMQQEGLSNANTQWHMPDRRINRGEEGLKQQSSESRAQTGENNLQISDPGAFTPAGTNTHCQHQICKRGRKYGDWKMTPHEWDSSATQHIYWKESSPMPKLKDFPKNKTI